MAKHDLNNSVKRNRELLGLSQRALGERVDVTRQAIVAIEAGRQVPSTSLALRLARALGCSIDTLFQLTSASELVVRVAPDRTHPERVQHLGNRLVVGKVRDDWVAHRLPADPTTVADAVMVADNGGEIARARPLSGADELTRHVLVAGCAPLLSALSQRVARRFFDMRATWLPASSQRALALLDAGLVHVAGIHLHDDDSGVDNLATVRQTFPGQKMIVVNLTRWRQGFVVATDNPKAIETAADLLRPGIRFASREQGAGANKLVSRLLGSIGGSADMLTGPMAWGHREIARHVRCGSADVGVAIENVALAAGLGFVPLLEERFDLVIPATFTENEPVARLIDALDEPAFRSEIAHLPGYDGATSGHVTTVQAA